MSYTAIHEHVCLSQRLAYRRNHLPRNPERCMCATFVTRFSLPRVIWGDTKTLFIINPPAFPVKYAAETYRRDYLRKHHTRKHPVKKYDIPCTYTYYICQKSFHYQGNYRKHLKTHQPTVPPASPSAKPEETVHGLPDDSLACPRASSRRSFKDNRISLASINLGSSTMASGREMLLNPTFHPEPSSRCG